MKRCVAQKLNELADALPLVFTAEPTTINMFGWELNLTPYGDVKEYEKDKVFEVPFFQLRAVEHKQQVKDAFKRNGIEGVNQYIESVKNNL